MCALEHSTLELAEAPPQPAVTPEVPTEPGNHSNTKTIALIAAAVFVVILVVLAVFYRVRKPAGNAVATYMVERAPFVRSLRLKGTTEAVQSRTITAPILAGATLNTLVITRVALAGTKVKKGDLLVEFDRQVQIKDALDKQADYQ